MSSDISNLINDFEKLEKLDKEGKFKYLLYSALKEQQQAGDKRQESLDKLIKGHDLMKKQINGLDVHKIENAIESLGKNQPVVAFKQKLIIGMFASIPSIILFVIAMIKFGQLLAEVPA